MYSCFRGNMSHGKGGENVKKVTKIEGSKSNKRIKNRVAAYIRVSTSMDAQTESFDAQERHYQELFKQRRDWEPVGIYADEGISGTSMQNRQGIQHLLDDCRNGKIDLVLTKSISRFARNLTECLEAVRELSFMGVAIHFDKENLNTQQMDGELLLSMLGALAENESKSISKNSKWSFKKRVENGTYKHVSAPFGYDILDGKLVINEEKACIVRDIFNWYLSGAGTYVIAKRLDELEVEPERGVQWKDSSVMYILKNERYIGDALFQKTYTDGQYKRHKNNFDVDMMYAQETHEAIVERKVFDQAQQLIKQRQAVILKKDTKVYANVYALSGRIHCQHCEVTFKRRTHYLSKDRSYIAWTCNNRLKDTNLCHTKFIKEMYIEEAFVRMMNKLVFGRKEVLEQTIARLMKLKPEDESRVHELKSKLKEVQNKLHTLSKLLDSKDVDNKFYLKEEAYLQNMKKELLAELRRTSMEDNQYSYQIQEMKSLFNAVNQNSYFNFYNEALLERFVKRIVVENRKTIIFELTCGLHLKEEVRV